MMPADISSQKNHIGSLSVNERHRPREIGVFLWELGVGLGGVHTEHPEDLFFFVATVTSGVDTDGGELATFAPALDGEGGNTENFGDFGDS
jgi:hypothetical protein